MTETELRARVAELEAAAFTAAQKSVPLWAKIAGAVLVLALLVAIGIAAYLHFNKPEPVKPAEITKPLVVQPQVIHTNTETVREVTVEAAPKGNIMQFVERDGKQFVVIDGKEYQLASTTGPAQVKIGENGQIKMTTETVAKIDVTDMVRAQVNDKLAIQSAELKQKYDKKWTFGMEITNKDASIDITHKKFGVTVGRTWKDGDVRAGPRYQVKF